MQTPEKRRLDESKVLFFLQEATRDRGYYLMQFCVLSVDSVDFSLHLAEVDDDRFHIILELFIKEEDRSGRAVAEHFLLEYGYGRNIKRQFFHGEDLESLSEEIVEIVYQAAAACRSA